MPVGDDSESLSLLPQSVTATRLGVQKAAIYGQVKAHVDRSIEQSPRGGQPGQADHFCDNRPASHDKVPACFGDGRADRIDVDRTYPEYSVRISRFCVRLGFHCVGLLDEVAGWLQQPPTEVGEGDTFAASIEERPTN